MLIHPQTTVLCVVDPTSNIGSGGATVNAIVYVTEYISALEGHTVTNAFFIDSFLDSFYVNYNDYINVVPRSQSLKQS